MSRRIPVDMKDFSSGMNNRDNANLIPDNALVDAQNVILGRGYVAKRNGYQAVGYSPQMKIVSTWADIGGKKWGELK